MTPSSFSSRQTDRDSRRTMRAELRRVQRQNRFVHPVWEVIGGLLLIVAVLYICALIIGMALWIGSAQ